uniref:Putative group i salivary lipocalin n=1 Tax=Rhipicephalus pulchellus TaxID=72859 RepID=L7LT21_RHIPC
MTKAANKAIAALALPALILMLKCEFLATFSNAQIPDITKFYDSGETIWTVNTTMETKKFCKVDFVNETNATDTYFERCYFFEDIMQKEFLHGKFMTASLDRTRTAIYDTMILEFQNGTTYGWIERLLHEYGNYQCGVFLVSSSPKLESNYYDVRLKQSTIQHPNSSCVQKFQELVNGSLITTMYNNSCQQTR